MRDKKFIRKAEYPGGSSALKSFVRKNLTYPKEAINQQIEGKVYVKYEVNNAGEVHKVSVINGIGYGCDEEAMRIINLLKYPSLNNKNVRVNTKFKITINFKLPQSQPIKINYIYSKKSK